MKTWQITPKGFKKVARGWSEAEPPGGIRKLTRILKGCERSIASSHPFRMRPSFLTVPGVSALLQPLATFFCPSGAAAPLIQCRRSSTSGITHNLAKKQEITGMLGGEGAFRDRTINAML
jgi:hypothetical protein